MHPHKAKGRNPRNLGAAVLCVAFAWTACSDDEGPGPLTVMVIDNEFDPGDPTLAGKIRATFTLNCVDTVGAADDGALTAIDPFVPTAAASEDAPDGGSSAEAGVNDAGRIDAGLASGNFGNGGNPDGGPMDGGTGDDHGNSATIKTAYLDYKADLIASLSVSRQTCTLARVTAPAAPFLPDERDARERWNQRVLQDKPIQEEPILQTLAREVTGRGQEYHGAAVASVIARANNNVQFVLIDRPLGSAADLVGAFNCPRPEDIELAARLLRDPDVIAAFRTAPDSSADDLFRRVAAEHDVKIVNRSFGSPARYQIENILADEGCRDVDLKPYFAAVNGLVDPNQPEGNSPEVLFVDSAGNGSSHLDGPADALSCPGPSNRLWVGSHDRFGDKSDFSNTGNCVEVFAPGESIVSHLPGPWLLPRDGTSFAAPLVTRWLINFAPRPFSPETARAAIGNVQYPDKRIPWSFFPQELIYEPSGPSPLALTVKPPAGESSALDSAEATSAPDPVAAAALSRPFYRDEVRRLSWPLRWLRRRQAVVPQTTWR